MALGDDRVVTWRENQDRLLVSLLDGTRMADVAMRPPTTPVGDVPQTWTLRLTTDPGPLVARNTDADEVHLLRTAPLATEASAVHVSADGRVLNSCPRHHRTGDSQTLVLPHDTGRPRCHQRKGPAASVGARHPPAIAEARG